MSRQGPLSNESFQGKLRNRQEQAERQRRRDLAEIMSTPSGRRFMYDLLFNRCNMMAVYLGQDSGIYRHEGRRSLAVELGQELQTDLAEHYVKMVQEHLAELADDAVIRGAALASVKEEDNG
jgi:hypothetical protein